MVYFPGLGAIKHKTNAEGRLSSYLRSFLNELLENCAVHLTKAKNQ